MRRYRFLLCLLMIVTLGIGTSGALSANVEKTPAKTVRFKHPRSKSGAVRAAFDYMMGEFDNPSKIKYFVVDLKNQTDGEQNTVIKHVRKTNKNAVIGNLDTLKSKKYVDKNDNIKDDAALWIINVVEKESASKYQILAGRYIGPLSGKYILLNAEFDDNYWTISIKGIMLS